MKNTLSIDKAGRMVLPLALRKRFGLCAGAKLELVVGTGVITLQPIKQKASLRIENGLCVHEGVPVGNLLDAIEQVREERIQASWGGQDDNLL